MPISTIDYKDKYQSSVCDRQGSSVNLHPAYPKQQTLNEKGDGTLLIIKQFKKMETKDIIKITALVFSKKKTIAQVSKEYKAIHGKELPIKSDLETLQAQLSLGGIYQW